MDQELSTWSCVRLASALRAGDLSAAQAVDYFIARIESVESKALNAVVVENYAHARQRAKEADDALADGKLWGKLHGVPMTVKEEFDVQGLLTCSGRADKSRHHVAANHSPGVQRLIDAGAIILGKSNVPVGCLDWDCYNPVYGVTYNPWGHDLTPGGSSGGAAVALAACLVPLELGGDTAGSIRVPAALCGVLGHSPTFDLVPWGNTHGVPAANAEPFSGVAGPMAREVDDLLLAIDVLAGPPPLESRGLQLVLPPPKCSLAGCRVAVWSDDPQCSLSEDMARAVSSAKDAVRASGGTVLEGPSAQPPEPFSNQHSFETYLALLGGKGAGDEYVSKDATEGPLAVVARGRVATHAEWKKYNLARHELRMAWHRFFSSHNAPDVVLCPIVASAAWSTSRPEGQDAHTADREFEVDSKSRAYAQNFFWPHFAIVSGLPATSFRAGRDARGLPLGLQVMGAPYMDKVTISVAGLLMDALGDKARFASPTRVGPAAQNFK